MPYFLARGFGLNIQVTGIGSLIGLHRSDTPVTDYRKSNRADNKFMRLLHLVLLERGLFIGPRSDLCISTPMSDQEIDAAVIAINDACVQLL